MLRTLFGLTYLSLFNDIRFETFVEVCFKILSNKKKDVQD